MTLNGLPIGAFAPGNCPAGCVFGQPLDQIAFRGTVYGGYNLQLAPNWLVGIEGDVGFASRTRTLSGMNYPFSYVTLTIAGGLGMTGAAGDSFAIKTSWDASVRGRLGWLYNPSVLLYVTGGVTWLNLQSTSTCSTVDGGALALVGACGQGFAPRFQPSVITDKATRTGGTVGGGLEAKLTPNLIARGEYRYSDYGTVRFVDTRVNGPAATGLLANSALAISHEIRVTTHTATFGLSYLFGGPVVANY
jgi:outer membrane immunogenic protein